MGMSQEGYVALVAFTAVLNWLLAYLVFYLRYMGERAPMTLSQRWGLSILAWLFLGNAILISLQVFLFSFVDPRSFTDQFLVRRLTLDLEILTSFLLLTFGMVYPRLIVSWNRMIGILGLIAVLCLAAIVLQSFSYSNFFGMPTWVSDQLNAYLYIMACFIPIFIWLPEYERQNSPQMRMTLTILIWGYLFVNASLRPAQVFYDFVHNTFGLFQSVMTTMVAIVYILLIRAMYFRLGRWSTAEWTNLILMFSAVILGIAWMCLAPIDVLSVTISDAAGWQIVLAFAVNSAGWMIIRPLLFSYGLLRFQMFGPDVRADRQIIMIVNLLLSVGTFLAIVVLVGPIEMAVRVVIGLIGAAVLFFLFRTVSYGIVSRLLPMSGGGEAVPLKERRITYLMGLQTAVFEGEVDQGYDEEALKALRRSLRIMDREHELLMHGFARERTPTLEQGVEEVYLFDKDGELRASDTRGTRDTRKEMVASMFTAVKDFSKDALKEGSGYLGAIEYGDRTLIIEVESDLALGAILRGKDNPQVRQRMRDVLRDVDKMQRWKDAKDKDGKAKSVATGKALDMLLNEFIKG